MRLESKTRKEWADIWRRRIQIAQRKHKEKVIDWANKVIKEYSGDYQSNQDTGEKYKQVAQVIYGIEENIQPHLFFQNPHMIVQAKRNKSEWAQREELVEAMVNQEYSDIRESGYGIELENELALIDARIIGYGVTKTSLDLEGGFLEEPPQLTDQVKNLVTGEPREQNLVPVIEKESGQVTEHVCSLDIILDPYAKHITKQKFIVHKMDLSKDDLRKARYEQDKVEKLKPTMIVMPELNDMGDEEKRKYADDNPDAKGFRVYEIHDLENKVVHSLVDGFEDFIEFGSPSLVREGSQFTFLWFKEEINEVYPSPPMRFYRKRALEFSYIYTQISDQIDKFMPKIGVDIDRLDKPEKDKFRTQGLGGIFATKGNPGNAVGVFTSTGNIESLIKYLGLIKEMLNLESATNEYETANPEKRKATEALQIQQGTSSRRFKPRKRVASFVKNQAHTIWQVIRDHYPFDRFAEVLGPEQAMEWWVDPQTGKQRWVSDESLKDYDFDFDMDTMAPQDDALKKKQNTESIATVGSLNDMAQTIGAKISPEIIQNIIEKYISENLKIRTKGGALVPITPEEMLLQAQAQLPPPKASTSQPSEVQQRSQAEQVA